ncbi:hypothetical protein BOS5A_10179 [Bosea sp. EC-HK365B]|nr:hypothetical protein BOSE21B_10893 [Bosea sp. 21B]CAD5262600.1 hypothetical protein BOSE7B_150244 [Bosea sp. 7B]VVT43741.1 hypothetical protein BOS5A_10179 [Bosea sp. EC-HK365B]VXB20760.1 hypothetical protein BOSE29B_10662 [Bosea sp. 29B]VXC35597.1 hypothetical protein BOSE127_180245 [Bosea sp. 127]
MATPIMKGRERRKPKWAPDAVARVVVAPGVTVEMAAKAMSGRIDSGDMGRLQMEPRE